jgi:hypothetical protein
MTKENQTQLFDKMVESQREIMLSKGDDYANADRLSNFKSAAYICGLSTEQHCLAMIATKVARLGVLLDPKAKTPKFESVQDSVLDLANYAQLLNMIIEENGPRVVIVETDKDGVARYFRENGAVSDTINVEMKKWQ